MVGYFRAGCKPEGQLTVGLEVEHFLTHTDGAPAAFEEVQAAMLALQQSGDVPLVQDGETVGLRSSGYVLTLEPAAQLEISITPQKSVGALMAVYEAFAARLRERLPRGVRIWKAVPADAEFPRGLFGETVFDRFVLDSGRGGTGTTFPWEKIPPEAKLRALLAGGLSPENARAAHRVGCVGLDFNSGVENAPGEKSAEKIRAAFAEIRKF